MKKSTEYDNGFRDGVARCEAIVQVMAVLDSCQGCVYEGASSLVCNGCKRHYEDLYQSPKMVKEKKK